MFFVGETVLVVQKGKDPYRAQISKIDKNGDAHLLDGRIFDRHGMCKTSNLSITPPKPVPGYRWGLQRNL